MRYKQGDIILIPYPYTDLSQNKQRPAVIISNDASNRGNYIVAKVTSVIRNDAFSFPIGHNVIDREMNRDSEVRTNELFTVSESIVIKKFASFNRKSLSKLLEAVKANISLD